MDDEIQKLNGGAADFDFDNLTVEELDRRLELAIGLLFHSDSPRSCIDTFKCGKTFACASAGSFACSAGFDCTSF